MAGGGLAAVIYNQADTPPCEAALAGGSLNASFCGPATVCAPATHSPTVGLTRKQGKALLALLAAGTQVCAGPGRASPAALAAGQGARALLAGL